MSEYQYNKVIFVCEDNLNQSPMAEWIFKSIVMDSSKEICSRGLVVLFEEPVNQKVMETLHLHGVPCKDYLTFPFRSEEVDEHTLIITMVSTEKIKIAENFEITDNVYTLTEFTEEEGEVMDPYATEDGYELLYNNLKELLYKMKEKLDWE